MKCISENVGNLDICNMELLTKLVQIYFEVEMF